MTNIHNTAIISSKAKIGDNVSIGPYCNIDGDVTIRDNVTLISHISISGSTTIGENTKIWPFSVIGSEPQDLKYDGEKPPEHHLAVAKIQRMFFDSFNITTKIFFPKKA